MSGLTLDVHQDATVPYRPSMRTLIPHVVNNVDRWGAGFTHSLDKAFGFLLAEAYHQMATVPGATTLGNVQYVYAAPNIWVANMFAQRGTKRLNNEQPLDMAALTVCLANVSLYAKRNEIEVIQMPKIGSGLAGGSWPDIRPLVLETLAWPNHPWDLVICHYTPNQDQTLP